MGRKIDKDIFEKLNGRNREIYGSIDRYFENSLLSSEEKNDAMEEVLDMLLSAQEDGRDPEFVIGDDHQKFCEDIIREYSRGKSLVFRIFNGIQRCFISCIIATVAIVMLQSVISFKLKIDLDVSELMLIIILSLFLVPAGRKQNQKVSFLKSRKQRFNVSMENMFFGKSKLPLFGAIVTWFILRYGVNSFFGAGISKMSIGAENLMMALLAAASVIFLLQVSKIVLGKLSR